ncbi:putative Glutathione S-transferase [Seiridium unicorne]|uniref:Glutathione S-transferase n=1 Tax=Seiridium unicorne TaxID=138068 RepID=A0ABR2UFE0_9PEZI
MADSNITLYTTKTPNGQKASIVLEELGLKYTLHAIELGKDEQKEPWFLEINPNGRIPAITDTFTDGSTIRIFESGSILQYLVERYDTGHKISYPKGTREYWEVNNWLFWQMGGLGPMQGQANHFFRYAPEKIEYGINRYKNEVKRLYRVMSKQLEASTSGFLVGDRLTIADIACWGWVASAGWAGIPLDEFPKLKDWVNLCYEREGFKKGFNVPPSKDTKPMTEEEHAKQAREWILRGMKEDASKEEGK